LLGIYRSLGSIYCRLDFWDFLLGPSRLGRLKFAVCRDCTCYRAIVGRATPPPLGVTDEIRSVSMERSVEYSCYIIPTPVRRREGGFEIGRTLSRAQKAMAPTRFLAPESDLRKMSVERVECKEAARQPRFIRRSMRHPIMRSFRA
jgi:hypothetical protein